MKLIYKALIVGVLLVSIPVLLSRGKNQPVSINSLDELEDISDTLKAIRQELVELRKELKTYVQTRKA